MGPLKNPASERKEFASDGKENKWKRPSTANVSQDVKTGVALVSGTTSPVMISVNALTARILSTGWMSADYPYVPSKISIYTRPLQRRS